MRGVVSRGQRLPLLRPLVRRRRGRGEGRVRVLQVLPGDAEGGGVPDVAEAADEGKGGKGGGCRARTYARTSGRGRSGGGDVLQFSVVLLE